MAARRHPALCAAMSIRMRLAFNALAALVWLAAAVQRVASRLRAGVLSTLSIGPQSVLAAQHLKHRFWNVTVVEIVSVVLAVTGLVMIGLGLMKRREAYLSYFGWLSLAWGLLSMRLWWRDLPWDNGVTEFLI